MPANDDIAGLAEAQHARLFAFVRSHVRSPTLAADIAQDSWLRLMAAVGRVPIDNLRHYLFRTARNAIIDHHRRERVRALIVVPVEHLDEVACPAPSAERQVIGQQELARLLRIVAAMPPRRQQVFVLRAFEQVDQATIAATLRITRGAVEKHLRLALAACALRFYSEAA